MPIAQNITLADRIVKVISNAVEDKLRFNPNKTVEELSELLYDELISLMEKADKEIGKEFVHSPLPGMNVLRSNNFQVFYDNKFISPHNKYF